MSNLNNIVVIIPCYEPSYALFVPYAEQLCSSGIGKLVIVNDGSDGRFDKVFDEVCRLDKVVYLKHGQNCGKGRALKTAFEYCKQNFNTDTVYVTADCDGQHGIDDVLNVACRAAEDRGALYLGVRDFDSPCVPIRSRIGNVNTRRMLNAIYGIKLTDTQTGLRAFSYDMLDALLAISGERFEYEMNMIIVLYRKSYSLCEVPIRTIYEQKQEDVETVSHFKTFSDSRRILGILFKNLGWYAVSSVLSSAVDVGVFALLFGVILGFEDIWLKTLVATVVARILSSIVNFTFNYKLVFHGVGKRCILRYYLLWAVQLGVSYSLANMWASLFVSPVWVAVFKAISDVCLAILSYQIQNNWVFANRIKDPKRFYGPLARFCKGSFRLFTKKYQIRGGFPEEGCVYVCRHLNMQGCYTFVKTVKFHLHIMTFNVFFKFKTAYAQYSGITFAEQGKKPSLGSRLRALPAALFVPALVRSTRAIPVYRGETTDSVKTVKAMVSALSRSENVLVFPDIDYKAGYDKVSDIYKGFLLAEKHYFRKYGKHIKFVPVYIDSESATIEIREPISFEDGDFRAQLDGVADKIRAEIQKK